MWYNIYKESVRGGEFIMSGEDKTYFVIDLKSFFASVECVERGLDPMKTLLVVADPERTEGTICLAVTPAMKALGVRNRCRVYEIPKSINYITAPPRMKLYIDYSARIYSLYLKYFSASDMHIYSIDEVFIDATHYLSLYGKSPWELADFIMNEIYEKIGVRATCGIGTNMYLAKIALDIMAKHSPSFIGYLDEEIYKETLWEHRPLTDFWRVGSGTAARLEKHLIYTMGDIARAPEDLIYKLFGIDGELLIDHAWGREPTSIADIKAYSPQTSSISSGQVLPRDYSYDEAKTIIKEMVDNLALSLIERGVLVQCVMLDIGYSTRYRVENSHGSLTLPSPTSAASVLISTFMELYEKIVDRSAKIRKISIAFCRLTRDVDIEYDLFTDIAALERERRLQTTILSIKKRFGKNSVLKMVSFEPEATMRERNSQIGGHKSGE